MEMIEVRSINTYSLCKIQDIVLFSAVDPHSVRGIQQKQSILASKQLQPQVPKQERRSYQLPIRDTTGRTYTGREGSGNRRSTYEEEMLYKSSPIKLERSLAVYEEDSRSRHSRGSYYRASSSRLSSPDSAYTTRSQSTTRSGKSDFIRSELPVRPAPAGKQREIKRRVKHFT